MEGTPPNVPNLLPNVFSRQIYLSQMGTVPQHGGLSFSSRRLCWLSVKPQLLRAIDCLPSPTRDPAQFFICCCTAYSWPTCALLYFSLWDNVCTLHTCACVNRGCTGRGKDSLLSPTERAEGPGLISLSGWLQPNNDLIHRRRCVAEVILGHMGSGAKPPHSRHDSQACSLGLRAGNC